MTTQKSTQSKAVIKKRLRKTVSLRYLLSRKDGSEKRRRVSVTRNYH